MNNPPPKNPRVNDAWIDDNGELHVWDGTNWVLYEDPPSPGFDDGLFRDNW